MLKLLGDHKAIRLLEERKERVKQRCKILKDVLNNYRVSLPADHPELPRDGDLAQMAPFRDIWDAPSTVDVTAASFVPALDAIPELIVLCRESQHVRLLAALERGDPPVRNATDAHLSLARTWFFCVDCREPVRHPAVLTHRCALRLRERWGSDVDAVLYECFRALGSTSWNFAGNLLAPRPAARKLAEWCVRESGLDPETATAEAMDAVGAMFVCGAYGSQSCAQVKRDWKNLVCAPSEAG